MFFLSYLLEKMKLIILNIKFKIRYIYIRFRLSQAEKTELDFKDL